jgi:glutathione synthase/RimK-type ligase-like ATP-grasp enzyme
MPTSYSSATATTGSSRNNKPGSASPHHHHQVPIRVSFVPLDPEMPLEEQHGGRIDVILHKLTEDILCWSQLMADRPGWSIQLGEQRLPEEGLLSLLQAQEPALTEHEIAAIRRVQRLSDFSKRYGCPLVDDPQHVQRLMSRAKIAETLEHCLRGVTSASGRSVAAPRYAVLATTHDALERITHAQLQFPLIVKPLTAAGTKASHAMAVLLQPSALHKIPSPCLCQEYVNHDSWLYKVYVLGDFCSVYKRRSLPNLLSGSSSSSSSTKDMIAFDSQRPYPRLRDFGYESLESTTETATTHSHTVAPKVTADEIRPIVTALKAAFGLELFGFDILVTSAPDDRLLVVDVNYFPSYKEVPNFPALLAKYLTDRAIERRAGVDRTTTLQH